MHLSTTFRHMDASKAVRECAEERLGRIRKYLHGEPLSAHAVFAVERNQHMAEFSIQLPNGIVIQARQTTEDMYSSIDLAAARIERQVRKWKDKIRDHKPHGGPSYSIRKAVLDSDGIDPGMDREEGAERAPGEEGEGEETNRKGRGKGGLAARAAHAASNGDRIPTPPPAPAIKVVREQTFTLRQMRVEDAVMQMNLLENDFFVFTDVDSAGVSVVYRRKDGNYGLIETGGRIPSS